MVALLDFILHEVRKCESWSMILNGNTITFYKPVEYSLNLLPVAVVPIPQAND